MPQELDEFGPLEDYVAITHEMYRRLEDRAELPEGFLRAMQIPSPHHMTLSIDLAAFTEGMNRVSEVMRKFGNACLATGAEGEVFIFGLTNLMERLILAARPPKKQTWLNRQSRHRGRRSKQCRTSRSR